MAKTISEILGLRDEEGRLIIGDPNQTCYNCGTLSIKVSADEKTVFYHPGVECCAPKINRLIVGRKDEIKALQDELTRLELRIREAWDDVGMATSAAAEDRLTKLARKAEDGLYRTKARTGLQIMELQDDIKRLLDLLKDAPVAPMAPLPSDPAI